MGMTRILALSLVSALAVSACSKQEEPAPAAQRAAAPARQPEMPAQHPPLTPGQEGQQAPSMAPPARREVVIPEDVKNTWKAVVLHVADKTNNTSQDVTVDIGQTTKVGTLDITVENFLPAFTMSGSTLTSSSNETTNPAAKVTVKENGQEIFSSFLFSMHPDVHPFQHEKYSILLKDFVKK